MGRMIVLGRISSELMYVEQTKELNLKWNTCVCNNILSIWNLCLVIHKTNYMHAERDFSWIATNNWFDPGLSI